MTKRLYEPQKIALTTNSTQENHFPTPPQLRSATPTPGKTNTIPDASDVMILHEHAPTPKSPVYKPRRNQKLSTKNKAMHRNQIK
jgi:hypothetical protein